MTQTWWTNAVGINLDTNCLEAWGCGWNLYKTLELREDLQGIELDDDETMFEIFTKDIFLSATFFIGTVITFALVYSWLLIVMWGASESQVQKWKDWVKWSLIWLVIIIFSYTIIRWIQFVAQGQS